MSSLIAELLTSIPLRMGLFEESETVEDGDFQKLCHQTENFLGEDYLPSTYTGPDAQVCIESMNDGSYWMDGWMDGWMIERQMLQLIYTRSY